MISHPAQEVGKTVPCLWCCPTYYVSVGILQTFLEWIAALSTTLRTVQFCRTLSDGRLSTRGFFRPLPASLRRPLLLASCGLSRSFVRLIRPLVGSGSVHHAPEMHHFIESAQKNRCLKRSSSGYSSAGVLTFRQATRVGFSVRDGGDVRHPHDGDDVRGVLRNPRAFR